MRALLIVALSLFLLTTLLPPTADTMIYTVQSVGARGELGCPYRDEYTMQVYVELWDEDSFDPDDLMGRVSPDPNGLFQVFGSLDEWSTLKPYLRIRHNCCPMNCGMSQEMRIDIPQQFVTAGPYPAIWFETGPIELAGSGKK